MKKLYTLAFALMLVSAASAQLVVDTTQTPEQIIQDAFLANGIFTSNITYTGGSHHVGTFNGDLANVGLGSGIIMGSGFVTGAIGPNNSGSFTEGSYLFDYQDADIIDILGGYTANDVSVVEFDFIATGDSLDFQYVFGSEEYDEFVGSSFNDGFAFFISGPGISGPYTNGAANIALIPGTNIPVAINNLNNGSFGNGPCTYCEYFIHNGDGSSDPYFSDPTYIQSDGFTTVLHASIGDLVIGEVYHIKLAIADASDTAFDSYVFLGGDSFVQFCAEDAEFLPEQCLLSTLDAHYSFTGDCGSVEVNNSSAINIDYTNCYVDFGDGTISDACEGSISHTYAEPGYYEIRLVYEVGEFEAQFEVGAALIGNATPATPSIVADGSTLTAFNWNGTDLVQWYYNGEGIEGATSAEITAEAEGTYTVTFTNSCGQATSEEFSIVGITEQQARILNLYPNPNNGEFTLVTTGDVVGVRVINSIGEVVYNNTSNGVLNIASQLPRGIYVVEVTDLMNNLVSARQKMVIR